MKDLDNRVHRDEKRGTTVENDPELKLDLVARLEAVERLNWAKLEPDLVASIGLDCFIRVARLGN